MEKIPPQNNEWKPSKKLEWLAEIASRIVALENKLAESAGKKYEEKTKEEKDDEDLLERLKLEQKELTEEIKKEDY
jgi:hypothetical protein